LGASRIWISISIPRVRKFTSISLNKFSAKFSLFYFWDYQKLHIGSCDP
jgi:hypothetical protein